VWSSIFWENISCSSNNLKDFFEDGFRDKDEIKIFNIGFELVHPGEFDIKYYIKYKQIKKILS
jgi:hypothetical protein